ncbi:MAG: hypothetical protein ACMV1B_05095 [Prevotella sp.]
MYASYSDYTTWLSGREPLILESEFDYYSNTASMYMDRIAPLLSEQTINNGIKACCLEVAEMLKRDFTRGNVTSENNDGWSVSYDTSMSIDMSIRDKINFYLGGKGLMYRGVGVIC